MSKNKTFKLAAQNLKNKNHKKLKISQILKQLIKNNQTPQVKMRTIQSQKSIHKVKKPNLKIKIKTKILVIMTLTLSPRNIILKQIKVNHKINLN